MEWRRWWVFRRRCVGKMVSDMNITRLFRHFIMTRWYTRRIFNSNALDAITEQIKLCESTHGGEIRVAIEPELSTDALLRNQSPRERATEVFAHLHVWDTDQRNGVLIYLNLADRSIEIIADRGLNGKVNDLQWQSVCESLQALCAQGKYQQAICSAIHDASILLAKHFPYTDRNELPDQPILL